MQIPITVSLVEMNKALQNWQDFASRRPTSDSRASSRENAQGINDAMTAEAQKGIQPAVRDQMRWPGADFSYLTTTHSPIKEGPIRRLWDRIKRLLCSQ